MKAGSTGTSVELTPNSRPFLIKRLLSDGFDIVLLFGLFMLFTSLIMKLPLAGTYHAHYESAAAILEETRERLQNDAAAISEELRNNYEYRNALFAANLHGYLLKMLAAFLAEALVFLLVPLLSKDRQTLGKLLTEVMPFSEKRQSRVKWYQVTARFLFIFFLDSCGLYLVTGILTFLLVPVLRLIEMLLNKKNKTVCDLMTGVFIIEKRSYDGIG